jgi:MFS family permease
LVWLEAVGLMINRFILCGFWSIFYVFVAELYPTQTRSLGYGWTSVMGMIGSTLSPFVTTISTSIGINSWFPPAIVGFISCLFIFKLPETFGKPLKDIIEELEKHHNNQK